MGVPALFRWLSKKYPKIIEQVIEERPIEVNGIEIPVDISKPNPNKMEFDNLYLDMNGIIHPCCHPDNKPAPDTEEDMMIDIFKYTERIVAMIRPRRVLYLAIDGVAPRAKMNQQRSRRFRTAQEDKEKAEEVTQELERLEASGQSIDTTIKQKKSFDSNCITPGTPFMARLAECLRYWIADKLNTELGWKNAFILSDASVPGEGEHKIMDFIRAQRASPYHDPNTCHVIYGLDADLIMLSLATHEPHFKVLREDVFFQEGIYRGCFICGQSDHIANQCTGQAKQKQGQYDEKGKSIIIKPYIFLNVQVLREYLEIELKVSSIPWPFNLENAIDDWVFLCFFVGNDFLPHLPSLEIREGAIDTLITIWKRCLPLMGGYLTNSGVVDLKRLQYLVTELGKQEDDIFLRRYRNEQRRTPQPPPAPKRRKVKANKVIDVYQSFESPQNEIDKSQNISFDFIINNVAVLYNFTSLTNKYNTHILPHLPIGMPLLPVKGFDSHLRAKTNQEVVANRQELRIANINAAQLLKAELSSSDTATSTTNINIKIDNSNSSLQMDCGSSEVSIKQDTVARSDETLLTSLTLPSKRKKDEIDDEIPTTIEGDVKDDDDNLSSTSKDKDEGHGDSIRLWEAGFKERYYKQKFGVELPNKEFQNNYIEGLCWGVPSWKWYYPYHYSPFASDFVDIGDIQVNFELGEPFKPFEQLMSVLPAHSKEHLPVPFQKLMTEEESEIICFYPKEFKIDLNGKKFAWQGVALLPFIDESRLLKAIESVYPQLNTDEITRNTLGSEILCFSNKHQLYSNLFPLYSSQDSVKPIPLDPTMSDKLIGFVSKDPKFIPESTFHSPLIEKNMPDITVDKSLSVFYHLPAKTTTNAHKSILLRNVRMDSPVLGWEDHEWIRNDDRAYHNSHDTHSYQNKPPDTDYQSRANINMYDDNRETRRNHYTPTSNSGYHYNNHDVSRYQYQSNNYENRGSSQYGNRYNNSQRYNRVNPSRGSSANSQSPYGQNTRFDKYHNDSRRDH
ncbi:15228_t:CDS:10 [Funneliformis geosporum]|uniref:5'-3' exoribonuclease n=1 Tax=Funneliformis geosporum TaxID=1117311 RepID=A0A9W4SRD6_9GLOM|nr:15228_t:CDS:10 [Funneliformis geosporum]